MRELGRQEAAIARIAIIMADPTSSIPQRLMTPAEVLAVFNSVWRYRSAPWSADMSLAQAFGALRLRVASDEICDGINKWFGTPFSEAEFDVLLEDPSTSTVADLCDLVASRACAACVDPPTSIRALEVVRELLIRDGAQPVDVTATAELEPLLRRHGRLFRQHVWKLAPGQIPIPDTEYPAGAKRVQLAAIASFVLCLVSGMAVPFVLMWLGYEQETAGRVFLFCWSAAMASMAGLLLAIWIPDYLRWTTRQLGTLRTLGELCDLIAAHAASTDQRPIREAQR